ncbi:MAG: hypothetical protein H7343_01800, partial [Undibacterium sp.]|nr:hypothetical protein [Opitutaceae bacterium]
MALLTASEASTLLKKVLALSRADDFAVLDFVEQLAAELEVIALLVDRVGTATKDVDPFFDIFHHL